MGISTVTYRGFMTGQAPPPPVRNRPAIERCLAASALAVAGVVVGYLLAVRTRRGQALELIASRGRLIQPPRVRGAAPVLLQTISVGSLALVMVVLLSVAILRRERVMAGVAAAVVAGSVTTTEVLKHWVFTRPLFLDNTIQSYPSGHSTVGLSVVIAAILVQSPKGRTLAAVLGIPYALAIGTATVVAGWHRPSDVFGAYLVVGAWSFVGIAFLRVQSSPSGDHDLRPLLWLAAVFGLFLLALGAVTLVGLREHIADVRVGGRIDAAKRALGFGVSMSSAALAAIVVVALVLYFLRPTIASTQTS